MTELRLTRRRLLGGLGAVGVGGTGLWAVPPRRVSATVSVPEWVLTATQTRTPDVARVESLDPAAREAVREAIGGGYETSDPPEALAAFLSLRGENYVRDGDAYYRLDPTLPVVEVWMEPVPESEATGAVTLDELEACIHPDPRGFVTPPLAREDDPFRTYRLDPEVRSCLDEHPYLQTEDGDYFEYHVAVDDPGAPYTLTATRVQATDVADVEGRVVPWEEVPADARDPLLAARGDRIERESVPDSLRALADEYEWFRREGTFHRFALDHTGAAPVRVDARVTDRESREFDPAWLELSVTNTGGEPVELSTGPPAPFGILSARRDDGGGRVLLWTREYVESRFIGVHGGRIGGVAAVGLAVTLDPGETRGTRYQIRRNPGRLPAGTYRVDDSFGVRVGDDHAAYPYHVRLEIE
ncbi:MAG: hypothetical protein ABEJ22_02055 [Haloferacaceae archaeon]